MIITEPSISIDLLTSDRVLYRDIWFFIIRAKIIFFKFILQNRWSLENDLYFVCLNSRQPLKFVSIEKASEIWNTAAGSTN